MMYYQYQGGVIVAAFAVPQPQTETVALADDHPDVVVWRNPPLDLSAYAAQKRWEKEVGGTVWGGYPVHTDRESQAKIIAERLAIEADERLDPDGWKFADGVFRMVSNEDFVEISNAVREHVRDCYATEAAVLEQIGAGTITTTAEIDAAFE